MPFADRFVTVQGRRVGYVDEGPRAAFPLICLHGGGFDHAELTWRLAVRDLRDGLRLVVPDLPGYGESEGIHAPHGLDDLGRWLIDFMDALGLARADVAGVSMGGGMALWVALERPERVRRVVPVGAYGLMARVPLHPLANFIARANLSGIIYGIAGHSRLIARAGLASSYGSAGRVTEQTLDEFMAVARDQRSRRSFDDFLALEMGPDGLRSDLTPRLPALTQPCLLIHGSADRVVPLRHARHAATLIPHARLEVMDAGHWPMRERPEEFNALLAAFLTASDADVANPPRSLERT